jgi:hypothetical protein
VPVGEENVFLPGMVGTINEDFVYEFLNSGGNVTINRDWLGYDTPCALEGWYKYEPKLGDSALIQIAFYNEGNEVFAQKLILKETIKTWKNFRVEIPKQYWDRYFTDICVLFVASAGVNFEKLQQCKGQLESTLWIDNIILKYDCPVGIEQYLSASLKANLFPNPANEVLNVELNENFTGKIVVYDLSGRMIIEEIINETHFQLNISTLATGNYIYKLMKENTIFAQGKFVVTK